jgi:hypothetical protein
MSTAKDITSESPPLDDTGALNVYYDTIGVFHHSRDYALFAN